MTSAPARTACMARRGRPAPARPAPVRFARLARLAALAAGLAAALALVARPARADGPLDLAVGPGSTVSYRLVHKLHEVTGVDRKVEGKVRLLPDGRLQAMVRVRVEDFDSGNGNRDAHMLEATEAGRFPQAVLKLAGALPPGRAWPAGGEAGGAASTVDLLLQGELTFHGVTRPVSLPVTATFAAPGRAQATGRFTISLDAFAVERPSLLFVKVDDALTLTASLALEAAP